MTTDIENPDDADTTIEMQGRIIGFGVTTAQNTRGTNEQILRISIVYNRCNCVGSTFLTDNAATPMLIVAGVDSEKTQTINYRENVIEQSYGQDCGGQTVALIA